MEDPKDAIIQNHADELCLLSDQLTEAESEVRRFARALLQARTTVSVNKGTLSAPDWMDACYVCENEWPTVADSKDFTTGHDAACPVVAARQLLAEGPA